MSIENRIKNIQQYTKNKEQFNTHLLLYRTIEACLSKDRSTLEKQGKSSLQHWYHAEIVLAEEPYRLHIDFLAHEAFEALIHLYSQIERLGGVGYELYQKRLLGKTLIKEWYPQCGTLYAKFYDPSRQGWTNESAIFKLKVLSFTKNTNKQKVE